jgi:hypothetical protein
LHPDSLRSNAGCFQVAVNSFHIGVETFLAAQTVKRAGRILHSCAALAIADGKDMENDNPTPSLLGLDALRREAQEEQAAIDRLAGRVARFMTEAVLEEFPARVDLGSAELTQEASSKE